MGFVDWVGFPLERVTGGWSRVAEQMSQSIKYEIWGYLGVANWSLKCEYAGWNVKRESCWQENYCVRYFLYILHSWLACLFVLSSLKGRVAYINQIMNKSYSWMKLPKTFTSCNWYLVQEMLLPASRGHPPCYSISMSSQRRFAWFRTWCKWNYITYLCLNAFTQLFPFCSM